MYNKFSEEAKRILVRAKIEMKKLKHPFVGSEHLLLSILHEENDISKKLKEFKIDYKNFKKEIEEVIGVGSKEADCFLYTPLLKRVMENAYLDSKENNNGVVTLNHLIISLLEEGEGIAIRLLIGMDIDLDVLYQTFVKSPVIKLKKNKKLMIEELGVDLVKKAKENKLDPVIGRDEEIKRIIEVLCRRKKNNPILIGDAGVGKTAIVEELSRLISINEVPNQLRGKRIINLDMSSLVAGTKYRGEFEERINKLLKECEENSDIILFIDEIHTIVGAGGAEGAIDASNIFKPALARGKLRCIGATTTIEYKHTIEEDKALDRRFQRINIEEPRIEILKDILMKLRDTYSIYHKTIISDEIIDDIIYLSNKYIHNRYQPDKSIDILDEVCAHASLKESGFEKKYNEISKEIASLNKLKKESIISNNYTMAMEYKKKENKLLSKLNELQIKRENDLQIEVSKDDVIKIISRKCNVPIFQLKSYDVKEIKSIEKKLKDSVLGHDSQIKELVNIIKRVKLNLNNNCYSMLFTGPSGVGKTLLAKKFGESLFNNIIKLDMSEYSEAHQVSKLIGSPAGYVGYNDSKNIFESVRNNPFSVIILDEIEKAHKGVINLFYQILDEGKIKDAKGVDIYFNNTIIIMTSNIGFLNKHIGFKTSNNTLDLREYFDTPFINRIDNIIKFDYLSKEDIMNIIDKKILKLKKKYKDIAIRISKKAKLEILDMSNHMEFGARRIDKIIGEKIESAIVNAIIDNKKSVTINNIKKIVPIN